MSQFDNECCHHLLKFRRLRRDIIAAGLKLFWLMLDSDVEGRDAYTGLKTLLTTADNNLITEVLRLYFLTLSYNS